jgi:predicted small integral membrane protein
MDILIAIGVFFVTIFTMLGILLTWEIIYPTDVQLADVIAHYTKR